MKKLLLALLLLAVPSFAQTGRSPHFGSAKANMAFSKNLSPNGYWFAFPPFTTALLPTCAAAIEGVVLKDSTTGTLKVCLASSWVAIATGTAGDVVGPSSSVDNAIVRFNGTTGKIVQDYTSGAPTISDIGGLTLGAPTTADAQADHIIGASAAGAHGLVIQAKATPTVAPFQVQQSDGTPFFQVQSDGGIIVDMRTSATFTRYIDVKTAGTSKLWVDSLGTNSAGDLNFQAATQKVNFAGINWLSSGGTATAQLGDADAASPVAQFLTAQGPRIGTDSNVAGPNFTIQSPTGTGNSTGSSLIFQTPTAAASGTTAQTQTTRLTLNETNGVVANGLTLTAATMTAESAGVLATSTSSYTWSNAQVVALGAALTGDITVATLPAKTQVLDAMIVITGQGAGATTFTVSCGDAVGGTPFINYVVASDAKAAANTVYGDAVAERGTSLDTEFWYLPSYTGTTLVTCHFITTVENLDQVTGSTGRVILTTRKLP